MAFVPLIACANVSSLFSAVSPRVKRRSRSGCRWRQRARVIRLFLCASLVFSAVAGLLGVLLAMWALTALQTLLSSQLPPNTAVTVNWLSVWFTGAVTCGCAFVVGLVPGLQASKTQLVDALKDSARGSSSARAGRFRSALMIAEVALAVVLLVGSGLLLLSFLKLQRSEPGFDPSGVAAAFVNLPAARYGTPAQRADFYDRVIARLRDDPKITGAGVTLSLPLSGGSPRAPYTVGGQQVLPPAQRPLAGFMIASDDFFRLMRIPMVEGRTFSKDDRTGGPGVCVINESLAHRLFPGQSALGHACSAAPTAKSAADRRRDPRRQDARPQHTRAGRDLLFAPSAQPARALDRRAHHRRSGGAPAPDPRRARCGSRPADLVLSPRSTTPARRVSAPSAS